MWQNYNANPLHSRVGDCTVRAISKALGEDWYKTYIGLCVYGFRLCDMPSANYVWGEYLKSRGFSRAMVDCCTVSEFCESHNAGRYVLALDSHVVAAADGDYYDTWDSGNEPVLYYWRKD